MIYEEGLQNVHSNDEVESLGSSNKVDSIYSNDVVSITHNQSVAPEVDLVKTVTRSIKNFFNGVADGNDSHHSEDDFNPKKLNDLLESHFDVGDAIQLNNAENYLKDEIEKSPTGSDANDHENNKVEPFWDDDATNKRTENDTRSYNSDDYNDQEADTETLRKIFTNNTTGELELPPDKGYAWVVVFSVFLVMVTTWGCNSAFGIFLSFFLSNGVFKGATKYDYALIAGFPVAIGQGGAPLALILMRIIGIKPTMLIGVAIQFTGFIWASFATELWELYVAQGVFIGLGITLIATPSTTTIPGWFLRKRAVAMGLSLLGTGLGGVIFGLASQKMISDNGNTRWCYRMLAITCTVCTLFATCLVRERKPIKPVGLRSKKLIFGEFKRFFDGSIVKRPIVLLIASWFNLAVFGYTLMIFTLASYAVARGMTQHQGSVLTVLLNSAQTVGRPVMGLMGDRFGRINVTFALTSLLCIYLFAFWIPANTFLQLIFFSLMVGSCVGVANVMNSVLIADMVKPHEFSPAWGFVTYSGAPLFLVCELIAQALTVPSHKSNPYLHTQIFAGFCFFGALLLSVLLRERAITIKLTEELDSFNKMLKDKDSEFDKEYEEDNGYNENWDTKIARMQSIETLLSSGWRGFFKRATYKKKI